MSDDNETVDLQAIPDDPKSAPADRATEGPLDESEANPVRPYIDLGGIKVLPREGLGIRLEIDEANQRVVAVTLDYVGSTLQVQAFAAPRSSGLWVEVRGQIAEQLAAQGSPVTDVEGAFGPELRARLTGEGGVPQSARFIGVDGPRWLLRGVIAGDAAVDGDAATQIDDLFRSLVVVRGNVPMPPRDLIPLQVPTAGSAPL
ncbi:MAG TPA: DUF3710 domain-containing protein [Candidatus Lumbricidophila sp.]|nr:DUF3710 domain-containing protein [Candidatus Lumbricidophila sp.]